MKGIEQVMKADRAHSLIYIDDVMKLGEGVSSNIILPALCFFIR